MGANLSQFGILHMIPKTLDTLGVKITRKVGFLYEKA